MNEEELTVIRRTRREREKKKVRERRLEVKSWRRKGVGGGRGNAGGREGEREER